MTDSHDPSGPTHATPQQAPQIAPPAPVLEVASPQAPAPVPIGSLRVGHAEDRAESEADEMADRALARLAPLRNETHQHGPGCDHVRRLPAGGSALVGHEGGDLDTRTTARIQAKRGGGRSMEEGVLRRMESGFGRSLTGVRIHDDSSSAQLNQAVSARAFTTGQDVFFGAGEYAPGTPAGERVLAHELAHTLQNTSGAHRMMHANATLQLSAPARPGEDGAATLAEDASPASPVAQPLRRLADGAAQDQGPSSADLEESDEGDAGAELDRLPLDEALTTVPAQAPEPALALVQHAEHVLAAFVPPAPAAPPADLAHLAFTLAPLADQVLVDLNDLLAGGHVPGELLATPAYGWLDLVAGAAQAVTGDPASDDWFADLTTTDVERIVRAVRRLTNDALTNLDQPEFDEELEESEAAWAAAIDALDALPLEGPLSNVPADASPAVGQLTDAATQVLALLPGSLPRAPDGASPEPAAARAARTAVLAPVALAMAAPADDMLVAFNDLVVSGMIDGTLMGELGYGCLDALAQAAQELGGAAPEQTPWFVDLDAVDLERIARSARWLQGAVVAGYGRAEEAVAEREAAQALASVDAVDLRAPFPPVPRSAPAAVRQLAQQVRSLVGLVRTSAPVPGTIAHLMSVPAEELLEDLMSVVPSNRAYRSLPRSLAHECLQAIVVGAQEMTVDEPAADPWFASFDGADVARLARSARWLLDQVLAPLN